MLCQVFDALLAGLLASVNQLEGIHGGVLHPSEGEGARNHVVIDRG